jgi:hypothetical protein
MPRTTPDRLPKAASFDGPPNHSTLQLGRSWADIFEKLQVPSTLSIQLTPEKAKSSVYRAAHILLYISSCTISIFGHIPVLY